MADDVDREAEFERDVDPGLSAQYRKASPWPLFVAMGFVLAEIGVILGLFPVAVAGLLLFGGTVAAILRESGYIDRPWRALLAMGTALLVVGAGLIVGWADPLALGALLDPANPVVYRGFSVLVAGIILGALGVTARAAGAGAGTDPF